MKLPHRGPWNDLLGPPTFTLFCKKKIESTNKFRYSPWHMAKTDKDKWFVELMPNIHLKKPSDLKLCVGHAYVQITSYRSVMLDDDNLRGGAKHLLDCLTKHGWINDDSMEWCDVNYLQEKVKRKDEETKIEIWRT